MRAKLTTIVLLAAALCAAAARAQDSGAPMFSLSGFGTLGLVHSSESKADFTGSLFKPHGAGHSRRWSADVDSVFAAQVSANLTPQLSAVLQLVSEQNYDGTYRPHVEWANIKYQVTPDLSVRLGRTVLPTFLLSDTRKLAYSYAWARPPVDVYGLLPITSSDGLDVSYRMHFGDLVNTVQANVGSKKTKLVNNAGTGEGKKMRGFSNTLESGPLTARVTYQKLHATIPSANAFLDAFRPFGPQGVAIADEFNLNHKPISIIGVGASYDPGGWFVMGEWGRVNSRTYFGRKRAWYASAGYRLGKFTPYATYSQAKADNLSDPGLTVSSLPPSLAGPATGLNAALNSILAMKSVQSTISVGGRWDFMRNAALKLQYDHTRIGAGSNGVLSNIQPGFVTGGRFNLVSATLDFVF